MYYKAYIDKHVDAVYRCYEDAIVDRFEYPDIYEYLSELADLLSASFLQEELAAYVEISNWYPKLIGKSRAEIFDHDLDLDDMRLVIAKSHGFIDWDDVDEQGDLEFNEHFERAVDHIQTGNIQDLRAIIDSNPDLVNESSPFAHEATLLHYCSTNGMETYHQKLPLNMPDMCELLIQKGASKSATMKCYGGEFNPHHLASTSGHPAAAGIRELLIEKLTP